MEIISSCRQSASEMIKHSATITEQFPIHFSSMMVLAYLSFPTFTNMVDPFQDIRDTVSSRKASN